MNAGVTGAYLRGIICPDETKEELANRVKSWPSPWCDIPVISASELAATGEEEVPE